MGYGSLWTGSLHLADAGSNVCAVRLARQAGAGRNRRLYRSRWFGSSGVLFL